MPVDTKPTDWKPVGVNKLEDAALQAVRKLQNAIVVAGPGAGKTELLAQRACYLLQTGLCPSPRQILAISFKRDAARNLGERVEQRCGPEMARRFHSYTFDAFAKGIVDRFHSTLPAQFRPNRDYELNFGMTQWNMGAFLRDELPQSASMLDDATRRSINGEKLYREYFVGRRLEIGDWSTKPIMERAAGDIWNYMLHGGKSSSISFPMIGRMAELLLRTNPKILSALRSAYLYLFLDEFQDTSSVHYDLTATAFGGSRTIITAVGDNKQRVNKWAGAMDGIFTRFQTDFDATRIRLLMNYRSAPELVKVQAVFAAAIDDESPEAIPDPDGKMGTGECRALLFPSDEVEAERLAEMIESWIAKDELAPRDVCILCRQRPAAYAQKLKAELAERGINARVENELQDLLTEPLTEIIVSCLRLCCPKPSPERRIGVVDLFCQLQGEMSESEERAHTRKLDAFLKELRNEVASLAADQGVVDGCVGRILAFFGESNVKAAFPQYAQGKYFAQTVEKITKELVERLQSMSVCESLDDLIGKNSLPIMTMHKSKGLEYHTVVFIGLEDSALFGFAKEPTEETCGFFVALSRAKNRAVFTFSGFRPDRKGNVAAQARTSIRRIYELLQIAGVEPERVE